MMEYRHLIEYPSTIEMWEHSASNEFCRFTKGLKRGIKGTETMQFIQKHEVSHEKRVTHEIFVYEYRPQNEEKEEPELQLGVTE